MVRPQGLSRVSVGRALAVILCAWIGASPGWSDEKDPDISAVKPDLSVPSVVGGQPGPGKRVRQTAGGYEKTQVYHTLYLPGDWQANRSYPVLVEFTGNGGYENGFGDRSTGRVEDATLGYGISGGNGFLWVTLPFLSGDGTRNVEQWWGDPPDYDPRPTVAYCKKAVREVCDRFGGDANRVILIGFSRGSIACNAIGLYDEEIASLWHAFICYSHYDGVREWPFPGSDGAAAAQRLKRLGRRPQLIISEDSAQLRATREYLTAAGVKSPIKLTTTGFRNHDDDWALRPSPARQAVRQWVIESLFRRYR